MWIGVGRWMCWLLQHLIATAAIAAIAVIDPIDGDSIDGDGFN